ncbi:hypothetical protein GGX14DRAFT_569060 [Mycena pura]|uniref:DUF6830 domain-containing protein n=1 Tax=Mycena pura TaxID=153505 RepID=A0AAD6Y7B6_9AGAR|nr:hypothetical protein GGX14DRAFT_569060 [Mycena pura]
MPKVRRGHKARWNANRFQCPGPSCGLWFTSSANALRHLNHPRSSCARWYRAVQEVIASEGPGAQLYKELIATKIYPDFNSAEMPQLHAHPPCAQLFDPPVDSRDEEWVDDISEWKEEFFSAAQSQEGGTGFQDWVDEDEFAKFRTDNLFYPFGGDEDFEFGKFLTLSRMTMKDINNFMKLKLVQKYLSPHLSFKTAKELRSRVEILPSGPKWKSRKISFDGFPTKKPLVLFYRDSLECLQFLLRNPALKDHINLKPTKLFRNGKRLHKEWINSDGAWQMQTALPMGSTLLGVIASSDKTNISVMNGDRVAHPFLLSLANIEMDHLMKASNNALLMTALLPVPKFLCNKDIRGVLEKRLFHHCLDIVCEPLKAAASTGVDLSDSDGQLFHCHTPLVAYIVDTPEAADIACVMGKTSHLTMASHHTFGDSFRHEERTGAYTWELITRVNAAVDPWDVADYQKLSKTVRLNGVHLPFWRDWPLSINPARFLTPEVLHHLHKGFFDHDFQWGRNIVGDEEIDFRLSLLQPRVGHRHFKEGVTRLKQLGGREHRELQRCFISMIADAVPQPVVRALAALMDFRFFTQSPQFDEATFSRMDGFLMEFHELKQSIIDAGGREQSHFNIPKLEFYHGIVPSIRWAGAPMQYTADMTEKAHSTQIKIPARNETNHRDYDPQIVRHLDRVEKLRLFSLFTDNQASARDDGPHESDSESDVEESNSDTDSEVAREEEDIEGPSLAGESTRRVRNLFHEAALYSTWYPDRESRMFTTSSTAFSLNRRPSLARITVDDAATRFGLPDLRAALGDYLDRLKSDSGSSLSVIGGRRHNKTDCILPFTYLQVWFSVRVQTKSPHQAKPLPAETLHAKPPDETWTYGRYDTVLLCNDRSTAWPGGGLKNGLLGHTIAQIRLIMKPVWRRSHELPPTTATLMYVQRFNVVPQSGSPSGREPSSGLFVLRRALRSDNTRMGDVVEVDHIRTPVELTPRFGAKADPRLSPYTSLEFSLEMRLNKYTSKEFLWIHDSVSL